MAETVRKKAAKKASGKKRGRPRKETVQPKRVLVVLARTLVTA